MSVRHNLETQIEEMEMIKSIFAQPGEFRQDRDSFAAVMAYVKEGYDIVTPPLVYSLKLVVDEIKLEVNVTLPASYPAQRPNVYVRDNGSSGSVDAAKLNDKLREYMDELDKGETCIWQLIMWLQENAVLHYGSSKNSNKKANKTSLSRYWIYSHHIYNKKKRRDIIDMTAKGAITGFMLPGRPGVICLEGCEGECHDVWQQIKSMQWQKIALKHEEKNCTGPRKFSSFEEVCFQGPNDHHMDMGKFLLYLKEHGCEFVFKEYFGCEGQTTND